jgi:hypothetical protein
MAHSDATSLPVNLSSANDFGGWLVDAIGRLIKGDFGPNGSSWKY